MLPAAASTVHVVPDLPAPAETEVSLEPRTTVLYLDHTAAWSGGEIALLRLLEALDLRLVRPLVLLAANGPLVPRLRDLGVETHILPLGAHVRELRKDRLSFGALRKSRALFSTFLYALRVALFARRNGVQIIHANSLKSDIYGGLAGRLAGVPVIWHVRDHINTGYLPAFAVRVFRFLAARLPTFVVTNSQSTLDELQLGRAHRHTAIIPSGLRLRSSVVHDGLAPEAQARSEADEEAQSPARPRHEPIRFGLVGRIARWKGQHIFIEAAARLLATGARAEFWIIGSPLFGEEAYEKELLEQVEKAGLTSTVLFQGFQQDVQAAFQQLDVVVHASITPEPFGQVVIEGMAEGLPVIATDGGGVREIVNHGKNGLLVPMGDAAAMAQAMESLLNDPEEAARLGSAGYRWVRRHFTAAQSARKIERVYRAIFERVAA